MPNRRTFLNALLVGASLMIAGCTDLPTAPVTEAEEQTANGLFDRLIPTVTGSSSGDEVVTVLERRVPLASDEVVTKTIGRWGGVIRLPRAGLTIIVPMRALDRRTEITVTAPAGNLVGYEFGPHGIDFNRPLTMIQDMTKTKGLGLGGLSVAYFEGDLEPTVTSLERIALRLLESIGIFRVHHFCGYVIATD